MMISICRPSPIYNEDKVISYCLTISQTQIILIYTNQFIYQAVKHFKAVDSLRRKVLNPDHEYKVSDTLMRLYLR